jgi:hypothetical protein
MKICALSQFGDKCHKEQVNYAIKALLDVVEQFGAAAAGPRIVAREAEKRQLEAVCGQGGDGKRRRNGVVHLPPRRNHARRHD